MNLTEVHFLPQGLNADNSQLMILKLSEKLQTTNETKYFFQTEIFVLPNEFTFKILVRKNKRKFKKIVILQQMKMSNFQVNGYSGKGNQLRRIISTSLQALNGPPPEILLNETDVTIVEGDSLLIECKSNSIVSSKIWIEYEQQQLTK